VAKSEVPGELAFPTQPFPVKPPPIARNAYQTSDLVTAADTSPEHVRACQDLIEKNGGVTNAGPFTPWGYRAEGAPMKSTLVFPGGLGGANWGGTAYDRQSGFMFVATQDVGALGWVEKAKEGSPVPYDKASLDRTFDVRMPGGSWPCQKPPWGRLLAVNTTTGDFAWQHTLGITEQLPADKQNTGRPVLAGPIVTASGLIFIGSTDDNRFRALDTRSGRELWVAKLERRGNADPITYADRNGKQYVAIVATDTLVVYTLP
jgi:quinoprotein glucose dehydrogenase